MLSPKDKRQLRAIGHKLKPIVTIASQGLTSGVFGELDRALNDHELIKVKISTGDRQLKRDVIDQICLSTAAEVVQIIGNTALLLRKSSSPNPKLSNLVQG